MSAARAIVVVCFVLSSAGGAFAQANGDPSSIILGTLAAREHADARSGHGVMRWRHELNAWQTPRKLVQEML